nr:MAG TPA: hypothetical protein [Caudoviricetes sp.]
MLAFNSSGNIILTSLFNSFYDYYTTFNDYCQYIS